jgi:hypothetical protein
VNLKMAGDASTSPERLLARTLKACLPKLSLLVVKGERQALKGLPSTLH